MAGYVVYQGFEFVSVQFFFFLNRKLINQTSLKFQMPDFSFSKSAVFPHSSINKLRVH